MSPIKVLLVGASGETGSSILNGLLEDGNFDVTALVRAESASTSKLCERDLRIVEADLLGPQERLVQMLTGIDVVISAIHYANNNDQIPLATAAKEAGVKRFVPCGFITVAPPRGVMRLRDQKEDVINHIKLLHLPYTYIDVGWWYQISFPALPSGLIDYAVFGPKRAIVGDGNVLSGLTDLRDIGRYVAKVVSDDRTLNKMVFAYNTLISQNEIYTLLERLSGESIEREYISEVELNRRIDDSLAGTQSSYSLASSQYQLSWGIRGDNTPDYAKYLGYLVTPDLYPEFKGIGYEDYLKEVVTGKAKTVYADRAPQ